MEKVWLKSYAPGVPAEIDTGAYGNIRDIFRQSCDKFADKPAFTCMDRTLSYRELDAMSRDLAAYLQNVAGLKRGSRVAIMMPNLLQYPVAIFAVLRAGMIVVNCNPLYTP